MHNWQSSTKNTDTIESVGLTMILNSMRQDESQNNAITPDMCIQIVHREDELVKYMNQIERGMRESSDDAENQRNEKFKELEKEDEDGKLVVPRRTRQIVNHCHRYYNRLFGNSV